MDNVELAERYAPALREIAARHITPDPLESEGYVAGDFTAFRSPDTRVLLRVRRAEAYLERYRSQFTLRTKAHVGRPSELGLILGGAGDYLVYGFAEADTRELRNWSVLDLDVFRGWHKRQTVEFGVVPGERHENRDGTAFRAYEIGELPPDFVLAAQDPSLIRVAA